VLQDGRAGTLGRAEQPLPEAPHGGGCSAPADCREAAALRRCVRGVQGGTDGAQNAPWYI